MIPQGRGGPQDPDDVNEVFYRPITLGNRGAASLGFEPRQRDSESLVLPLHHEATGAPKRTAKLAGFASGPEFLLVGENHFFAFAGGFYLKLFPALLRKMSRSLHHGVDHGVVMVGIVMEKQEFANSGIERERNCRRD